MQHLLMFCAVIAAAAASPFRARWNGATADAPAALNTSDFPMHCDLAVVGGGWGGAYIAWRMAVDTATVNASNVCVFEANGRVGGRIYSIHGLPNFADLAVDVGGYRFQEVQKLPADLVWKALKMNTQCYDWQCKANCEGTTCYVIKDTYGNNAGYASVIETMLTQLEAAGGVGRQVYFAARLTKVSPAPAVSPSASTLSFADGNSVTASKVILNMPGNAVEGLDPASTIFTGSANATKLLDSVYTFGMNKVYAWYEDAWWNSKLKLMEGYFTGHGGPTHKFAAPLEGRYHDGPQRCVIGKDTAGLPVYSGDKIQGGNCSGALEVYYGQATPYYEKLQPSKLQPLTVVTKDDVEESSKQLLSDVHSHLMAHHASKFKAAGIDPGTIPPPATVVLANWIADGEFTPGIGRLIPDTDAARKLVRKPVSNYDVYVVNQDYGYHAGWAVGSLIMAEKVLQAEIGLEKPSWLDTDWYEKNVVGHL